MKLNPVADDDGEDAWVTFAMLNAAAAVLVASISVDVEVEAEVGCVPADIRSSGRAYCV